MAAIDKTGPALSAKAIAQAMRATAKALTTKLVAELEPEAATIAIAMREKAHVKSSATRESIRVIKRKSKVIITAGGKLTTKEVRAGSGVAYDYVLAEEFGTQHAGAVPFFYGTFRKMKGAAGARIAQKLKDELA